MYETVRGATVAVVDAADAPEEATAVTMSSAKNRIWRCSHVLAIIATGKLGSSLLHAPHAALRAILIDLFF
jgi:hypothetical protein